MLLLLAIALLSTLSNADVCSPVNSFGNLGSLSLIESAGWTINFERKVIPSPYSAHEKCKNDGNSYYGWNPGTAVGSASYVVPQEVNEIDITFGSCWTAPNSPVILFKNSNEIDRAENGQTKTKTFSVNTGDTIELKDYGENSIVRIDNIETKSCTVRRFLYGGFIDPTPDPMCTAYIKSLPASTTLINGGCSGGFIPSEIEELTALTYLRLASKQLTGTISDSIFAMTALKLLYLDSNQLTGTIPDSISALTALTALNLHANRLTGTIPDSISKMTPLTKLYLNDNQLTGTISDSISALTALIAFGLNDNQLTGTISESISAFTALTSLYLAGTNDFSCVSTNMKNFWEDRYNDANNSNYATCTPDPTPSPTLSPTADPTPSPTCTGYIKSLPASTTLINNGCTGGFIPSEIDELTALTYLRLFHNQLTGTIPDSISTMTALTYLKLGDNQLTGTIPDSISALTALTQLDLNDNQLTGTIPESISTMTKLTRLYLAGTNDFSCVSTNMKNFWEALGARRALRGRSSNDASESNYGTCAPSPTTASPTTSPTADPTTDPTPLPTTDPTPSPTSSPLAEGPPTPKPVACTGCCEYIKGLPTSTTDIYFGCTGGYIPSEIERLTALTFLWIGNRQITGTIPDSISKLTGLVKLYLPDNQLTGSIPDSISTLTALTTLYLANNDFCVSTNMKNFWEGLSGGINTDQSESNYGTCTPPTPKPVAMFEYEAFPGYQCAGKPAMRIGAGIQISIEEWPRATDVEACLIACSNNNMCTGVAVYNYKCYLRTGYVFKKSKAERTCYEKKITDTYKEDVCTKVAENYLCDSDTCDARIGEYATKYCNVFASKRKIWGQVCETDCTGKVTTYSTKADAEHMRCEKSYNFSHTFRMTFGECKKACNEDSTCTMFEMRQFLCRLFNGGSRKAIPVDMQKKEPRTTYCYKIIQRFVGQF